MTPLEGVTPWCTGTLPILSRTLAWLPGPRGYVLGNARPEGILQPLE